MYICVCIYVCWLLPTSRFSLSSSPCSRFSQKKNKTKQKKEGGMWLVVGVGDNDGADFLRRDGGAAVGVSRVIM